MKRTVALKRNCCSLPDSKAQSNPWAMGTSESHPSSDRPPSWSPGKWSQAQGLPLRAPVCTEDLHLPHCSHSSGGQLWEDDCLILKRPNTQQKRGCSLSAGGDGGGTQGPSQAWPHAEETLGGCGGCVGGGCACEVLLGVACWVESWDNWSLLERDFNSAFSRSSKEFLSTNSFICSFRTSTSSLTAYIKWLFTRSCKEQVEGELHHRKE